MHSGGTSTASRAPLPTAFTTPPRPPAFQSLNPNPPPHATSSAAASTSASSSRHSMLAAVELDSPDQRRRSSSISTAATLRNGRPHSTAFNRRPSSIYGKGSLSQVGGASDTSGAEVAVAGALAPTEVGSVEMGALVDGLRRTSVARRSVEDQVHGEPRPRRREESAAPSEWGALGSGRGVVIGRTSPSSSLSHHSREASSASDTSFASLDAAPTPAQLAAPLFPPSGEPGYGGEDVTGAPSMARQETLKAIERPWMTSAAIGRRDGPRTPEQLRRAYGGGTSPETRRCSGESGGQVLGGAEPGARPRAATPPPRGGLLETPRTPPGGIRRLSLVPSPGLSPRSTRRPLSAIDTSPHPRSSVDAAPPPRPPSPSPSPPPLLAYVPFPASSPAASLAVPDSGTPSRAKSIDEIIALHAPPAYLSSRRASATPCLPPSRPPPPADGRAREESAATVSSTAGRSSIDSLDVELRDTSVAQDLAARRAAAQPSGLVSPSALALEEPSLLPDGVASIQPSGQRSSSPFSPSSAAGPDAVESEREVARLLKSPRLTRLFTLRRPPNAGLTVSLADVGSSSGHPVLVFLGLGAVRYLVALYDELADALGLRLICIDRWGLGRTGEVPDGGQRGFVEWASVVAELVSPAHLALDGPFSVLAHSAGAPYAVAAALHGELVGRVSGSLHLLAPWVSSAADWLTGPYRYLKHVPSSVLKAAQAAEWKVQGWRLGKPPSLAPTPVGWDARTGRLMNGDELERDERRSAEVGHGVALLNGGSPTNARKLELLYPEGGLIRAGPTATPPPPLSSPMSSAASRSKGLKSGWGGLLGGGGLGSPKRSPGNESADPLEASSSPGSRRSFLSPSPSSASRRASFFGGSSRSSPPPFDPAGSASQRKLAPSGLPTAPSRRSSLFSVSPSPSPTTPSFRRPSLTPSATSSSSHRPGTPSDPPPRRDRLPSVASTHSHLSAAATAASSSRERRAIPPAVLIDGLLRASHAESSSSGGTADLLVLLERASPAAGAGAPRGMGFAYGDVPHRCKVWAGDRDDRISLASVRWLERELDRGLAGAGVGPKDKGCEVRVVEGADHSLMANSSVMLEVLESLAAEAPRG
ncbi:hypothetical protein JCM8208_006509 [Rhodotorula glutinis]